MKMIANSRLRDAQSRMEASRAFTRAVQEPVVPVGGKSKKLIVPFTTDKGLCGGLNGNVVKISKGLVNDSPQGTEVNLIPLGDKGSTLLARGYGKQVHWSAGGAGRRSFTFGASSMLAEKMLEQQFDSMEIVYNQFNSIISFVPQTRTIASYGPLAESTDALTEYEFEDDDRLPHMRDLLEFQLASLVYQAGIENFASELGSRMSAMDNATKNAGEMIKNLNTKYNRVRQAVITTELTEIISGAAALE